MACSSLRTGSRNTPRQDKKEVQEILEGSLKLEIKPATSTIRLYISSDIADSQWERKYLQERVLPDLRSYCRSRGLQLHVVDLYQYLQPDGDPTVTLLEAERGGIFQHALVEVKLCQSLSGGPKFVTLLAQRYGHFPLKRCIPENDFEMICAAIEDQAVKQFVEKCYRRDTNAVPPQYVLLEPKNSSTDEWKTMHSSLCKAVRRAAKVALGKDPAKVLGYIMSATEEEISLGIFTAQGDPNETAFWFKRTFTDLLEQKASDVALPTFTDLTMGKRGLEFDIETMKTLNHLKEAKMPATYVGLNTSNIFEFSLRWQKNTGLAPHSNPAHSEYLDRLCEAFSGAIKEKAAIMAELLRVHQSMPVYQEVLCHAAYCKEKMKGFVEIRESLSSAIHEYLNGPSNHPLVVYGQSGSGKTSIMATAVYQLQKRNPVNRMAVILRFVGYTSHSSNICHMLQSICTQISYIYEEDVSSIPGEYKGKAAHFKRLLLKASAAKPLFIFLDALDQLSPEDGALGLSWLPVDLPPHVKVVLSTSSEVQYLCFPVLQSMLSKHEQNFIEVPQLSKLECQLLLRGILTSKKRKLTKPQEELVIRTLSTCPLPLYLHLMMDTIVTWTSYMAVSPKDLPPANDIAGHVLHLFHKLEEKHGSALVSHVIAYITASRFGLTETELLEVLACDQEVMEELNRNWVWSQNTLSSVPPLVWSKLLDNIRPLTEFRIGAGNALVLRWAHRQIEEVASNHYSQQINSAFGMLADYFSGTLVQKDLEKEKELRTPPPDRGIDDQPLVLNEESRLYNVRKLKELPHCLANCSRYADLENLLLAYGYIKACIHATSCADLITDMNRVVPVVPLGSHGKDSSEVKLLREVLSYSMDVLDMDASQLSTQMLGRLLPYLEQQNRSRLKEIVLASLEDAKPSFIHLQPLLYQPGNPLLALLQGHRDLVSSVATTMIDGPDGKGPVLCIVSSSWDKTLKSWDLGSTGVLKSFDGHTDKVLSVAISTNGLYAISGSADTTVRQWYIPTGECIHTMEGHSAPVNAVVVVTDGCKAISGSSDTTIKVWNSDPQSSSSGKIVFTLRSHRSPVCVLALLGNEYLASGAKDGKIAITKLVSGEALHFLQGDTKAISALAVTHLHSSALLCSGSELGFIKVWDLMSGELLHSLTTEEGKGSHCQVRSIAAGPDGKMLSSQDGGPISVWDLTSGSHLYDLPGRNVLCSTITDSGSVAITGSADSTLSVWDLSNAPVSGVSIHHDGPVRSVMVSPSGMYGLSSGDDGVVKIFDLSSLKLVREVKGHQSAVNCVLLLRDSQRLFTASSDKTVKLWNVHNGALMQSFEGHEAAVNCVAVSNDSKFLMSGAEDGKVAIWNIKTGQKLKTFSNHTSAVVMVAFTKTATADYMLSASKGGKICILDYKSAKMVLTIAAHTEGLLCVSVSPDATFIATGSTDTTCRVYSFPGGGFQASLTEHTKPVTAVKVITDCRHILTGSLDKTLRIWDVQTANCLACLYTDVPVLACDVGRNSTVLYGTETGWVSTALYRNVAEAPHLLLQKVQNNFSVTSSSTESQSSFATHSSQASEDAVLDDGHAQFELEQLVGGKTVHGMSRSQASCNDAENKGASPEELFQQENVNSSTPPCPGLPVHK